MTSYLLIRNNKLQVGQFVHRVIATDPDRNPDLKYSIDRETCEARNEEGTITKPSEFDFISAFDLNPVDGLIKVVKLLDRERVEVIRLAIRVEDLASVNGKQITSGKLHFAYKNINLKSYILYKHTNHTNSQISPKKCQNIMLNIIHSIQDFFSMSPSKCIPGEIPKR